MNQSVPLPWTTPPLTHDVSFCVTGEPATKSRARFSRRGGKVVTYTPEQVKQAEARMAAAFIAALGKANPTPLQTFGIEATFYVGTGQKRDVDNMLKLIMDGLNKIAWADDHQVYEVTGRKIRVTKGEARTEVRIYPIGLTPSHHGTCEHCGVTFPRPPSHSTKKYCSQACHSEVLRIRRLRTCEHCGVEFNSQSPNSRQRFCSVDCKRASAQVPATCSLCGKDFLKPRHMNRAGRSYCSDECRSSWWRESRKSRAEGTCNDCGGPTTKKTYVRCQACHLAAGGAQGVVNRRKAGLE